MCEKLHEIEKQNPYENDDIICEKPLSISPSSSSSASAKLEIEEKEKKRNKKYYRSAISPVEDPAKRYYRAFPSLSKDTEEKSGRKSASRMPLTWPNTSNTQVTLKKINNNSGTTNNNSTSSTAGVKRRSKRRRNNSAIKNQSHHRKANSVSEEDSSEKSSSLWDTNFEGSWEMGHDLIRDFILKQNKRNRSISENEVKHFSDDNHHYSNKHLETFEKIDKNQIPLLYSSTMNTNEKEEVLNTIKDEGYATPDTFTSFCELADIASSKNINSLEPRRLYEREVSNEPIDTEENEHLAMFEAKFNPSVEALWNNNENGLSLDKNCNNDLDMFWSHYHKHQYKPTATTSGGGSNTTSASIPVIIDPLVEYRSNVGVDYISRLLDGSSPNQASVIKKNDFIEAGTNLQSSIWSNNLDATQIDNGIYSRELWDNMQSRNNNVSMTILYLHITTTTYIPTTVFSTTF